MGHRHDDGPITSSQFFKIEHCRDNCVLSECTSPFWTHLKVVIQVKCIVQVLLVLTLDLLSYMLRRYLSLFLGKVGFGCTYLPTYLPTYLSTGCQWSCSRGFKKKKKNSFQFCDIRNLVNFSP
jgi:hypothetical protein